MTKRRQRKPRKRRKLTFVPTDDPWGTKAFLDRIDLLMVLDAMEDADAMIVENIGQTVQHDGRTYDTAAMLRGELVEVEIGDLEIGRMKSRGWLAASYDGAIPESEET